MEDQNIGRPFCRPTDYMKGFSFGQFLIHSRQMIAESPELEAVDDYMMEVISEYAVDIEQPAITIDVAGIL